MDSAEILNLTFFGNSLQDYLFSLGVFVAIFLVLRIFKGSVVKRLRKLAKATKSDFDDLLIEIIGSIGYPMYLLVSIGIALQFIEQPPFLKTFGFAIALIVIVYTIIRAIQQFIDYIFTKGVEKRLVEDASFDPSIIRLLAKALKGGGMDCCHSSCCPESWVQHYGFSCRSWDRRHCHCLCSSGYSFRCLCFFFYLF